MMLCILVNDELYHIMQGNQLMTAISTEGTGFNIGLEPMAPDNADASIIYCHGSQLIRDNHYSFN